MPLEKVFIVSKIERLKDNLSKIKSKLLLSDQEILSSADHLASLERYFQLVVDYAIDINHHFIKNKELNVPDDLQSTFTVLGDNEILTNDFADRISRSVGLRNRLVHQYEDVKPAVFLEHLRKNLGDYEEYARQILRQI
ncbi:MAG: hypothetical protein RL536_650 [Candidatus Parcubacteria bacterium]|jgi:uncharacterized protein YutE (UPF0331/DUF86 family)